jgi:hypothetical protein
MRPSGTVLVNPSLESHRLKVSFANEEGADFGGSTKDMFTLFWVEAFKEFFHGEDVVVPHLPLHRMKSDMSKIIAVGRIFSHTTAVTGRVPSRMSFTSIMSMIFGTDNDVPESDLIRNFLLFLVPEERALLKSALVGFDSLSNKQKTLVADLFQVYGLYDVPSGARA